MLKVKVAVVMLLFTSFLRVNGFYCLGLTRQRKKSSRCVSKAEPIVISTPRPHEQKWDFEGLNHRCRWNPVDLQLTSGRPLSGCQSPVVYVSPPELSSWFLGQFVFCLASALPARGTHKGLVWDPAGERPLFQILTLARKPPKWAPMLDSTFFFLASSSALFLASSSSFLCLSSCWSRARSLKFRWTPEHNVVIWGDYGHAGIKQHMCAALSTLITAIRVCLSRSFSALTRCCSALSDRRLSCETRTQAHTPHSSLISISQNNIAYPLISLNYKNNKTDEAFYNPVFESNQLLFLFLPLLKVDVNQGLQFQEVFLHPLPVDVLNRNNSPLTDMLVLLL